MKNKGITLIGMSEAGKTTLGPILAEKFNWSLYDVDDILIQEQGKLIGEILKEHGHEYLLRLETQCVKNLNLFESVLVTPGSIIYDTDCHKQLKEQTTIVWLDVPLEVLKSRFGSNPKKADAVIGVDGGFEALFYERRPLYEELADIRIKPGESDPQELASRIIEQLS